ncbi:hypothetical protein [Streptomyces profundus]|uniref:hypothetical protein n=1 Tax=Streptomyces profundus TaxID=2867410 RepID=UPI001D15F848|nr:hypothetical protein [Streptomyces sp. MA3_2.13]UED87583.1 hypothetical protein K4G22_28070 [Streptomyces sp. MA3_2.13]
MDGVLNSLGTKFAERWVTLLALPGVVFALTLALSWWLHPVGAAHALDPTVLGDRLDQTPPRWLTHTAHRLVLAALMTLLAVASAAAATELGRLIARWWLGRGRLSQALLAPLRRRRVRRAEREAPPGHHVPTRYLPERATRIGDHLLLAERRVAAQYGVLLVRAWPRLWQLCDDNERAPLQATWDRYTAAAVRSAWALGYLALGVLWWPAAVAGGALYLSAWAAARRAAAELGVLIEALTDTKLLALAEALGVTPAHGRFTTADGQAIDGILDKGSFLPDAVPTPSPGQTARP